MACDISNLCTTTAHKGGMSPFQKWSGKRETIKGLPPFGKVGLFSTGSRSETLDPHGIKCIMLSRTR